MSDFSSGKNVFDVFVFLFRGGGQFCKFLKFLMLQIDSRGFIRMKRINPLCGLSVPGEKYFLKKNGHQLHSRSLIGGSCCEIYP